MSVLLIALPMALVLGALAVFAFIRAARAGQFDDLDTPPMRILHDDLDERGNEKSGYAPPSARTRSTRRDEGERV